jgi:hypothetical protein
MHHTVSKLKEQNNRSKMKYEMAAMELKYSKYVNELIASVPIEPEKYDLFSINIFYKLTDPDCIYTYYVARVQRKAEKYVVNRLNENHKDHWQEMLKIDREPNAVTFYTGLKKEMKKVYGKPRFHSYHNYFTVDNITDAQVREFIVDYNTRTRITMAKSRMHISQ